MKKVGFILLLTCSALVQAQNSVSIKFAPTYSQVRLEPNKAYPYFSDSIQFQELKFYIGHIQLLKNDSIVFDASKTHYLVDVYQNENIVIDLPKHISFNQIRFELGVDSNTSVSGALEGDLDPSLGMYWTWQSGYIHWKLEADANIGGNRETITWHVGGYRQPFNTLRKVSLPLVSGGIQMKIGIDVYSLLAANQTGIDYTIMSPSKQAMHLADQFQNAFRWLAD